MRTWVERFPGRLERELEEFRERGLAFAIDSRELEEQGRVVLTGELDLDGDTMEVEVVYPDVFPFLRPEVYAQELNLDRHQNPYLGNLCLLDRSTAAWNPSDTAAWLVAERLPLLLSLLDEGGEALLAGEAPQGEPASVYFPGTPGTAVFVPEEALAINEDAEAGSGQIYCPPTEPPRLQLRGLLGEVVTKDKKRKIQTLARADPQLTKRFGGPRVPIRWVRLAGPPPGNSPLDVLAAADAVRPGFGTPPWQAAADGQLGVCGVVFKEEVEQGRWEDAWVFVVRARTRDGGEVAYLVRGERLAPRDLGVRIPSTAGLSGKCAAVIGLGALGAPLALELARAQVGELRLLDHDFVEPGNAARWPMGLSAVGYPKVDALAHRIQVDYPFTDVSTFRHQLGGSAYVRTARSETELDVLDRILHEADLVVDASAELGVQQLISTAADERGIAQVYLSATEGARGGIVASTSPRRPGCWLCLQLGLSDGTISPPPSDPGATVQPRGCASPTFTGTSFDLAPVVSQGVRIATSLLHHDVEDVIQVCSVPADGIGPATWDSAPLHPHERCSVCSTAAERAA